MFAAFLKSPVKRTDTMHLRDVLNTIFVALSFIAAAVAGADGINCAGNLLDGSGAHIAELLYMIEGDPAKAWQMINGNYTVGNRIGCAGVDCLFVQKTDKSVSGITVIKLLRILQAKCQNAKHGSIPLSYNVASNGTVSGNSYWTSGELTVNSQGGVTGKGNRCKDNLGLDDCIFPPPGDP